MGIIQKHINEKQMVPKTRKEWQQAYALFIENHNGKFPKGKKEIDEAKALFIEAIKTDEIELDFEERSFNRRFGLSGLIHGKA